MLQSIRDHTQGWIAGVIISLLILSFALWGIHSYLEGGAGNNIAAKVNGVDITRPQLASAYERLRRQFQMQSSTAQLSDRAEATLKQRALDALINVQVLKQASLKDNYRVSISQVDSFLENMPEFQVNGQFSLSRFQQLLETTLYNARDFLDLIHDSLLIDQPRLGIIFTSFALPNEVVQSIALVNQERSIQYAVLPLSTVAKQAIQISDEQIKTYYDQHQDDFKTPEQVNIEYVVLSLNDLMKTIHPTDEMLKNYYNENSSSYGKQTFEQVKDKVKDAVIRQQAEEQLANVHEKLSNITYEHPESLAPAVKELGLTVKTSNSFTKDKGADALTNNVKIRQAAFSNDVLNGLNNSDVIQVGDDYIVLRIKSHIPAALQSLDAVKNQITDKLKAAEVNVKTNQLAEDIKKNLQNGTSLDQIAKQYNLSWKQVGFIGRHTNTVNPAVLDAAFAMPKPTDNPKQTFAVTKVPEGYAIIALDAVKDGAVDTNDHKQYQVYAEQIQNTQGLMEYELYKQSIMKHAKITVE